MKTNMPEETRIEKETGVFLESPTEEAILGCDGCDLRDCEF